MHRFFFEFGTYAGFFFYKLASICVALSQYDLNAHHKSSLHVLPKNQNYAPGRRKEAKIMPTINMMKNMACERFPKLQLLTTKFGSIKKPFFFCIVFFLNIYKAKQIVYNTRLKSSACNIWLEF